MNTLTINWPISKKQDPHEPRLTTHLITDSKLDTTDIIHQKYYAKKTTQGLNYDNHKSAQILNIHHNRINGVWNLL